jgi:hypothetical protein
MTKIINLTFAVKNSFENFYQLATVILLSESLIRYLFYGNFNINIDASCNERQFPKKSRQFPSQLLHFSVT